MISQTGNTFFALSLDLLVVADLGGTIKHVNPAWAGTLGWSEAELVKKPLLTLVHPNDQARTQVELEKLAQGGISAQIENRYLHQDGSYRWITWTAHSDVSNGFIVAVGRDVTATKRDRLLMEQTQDLTLTGGWEIELGSIGRVHWTKGTHRIFGTDSTTFVPNVSSLSAYTAKEWRPVVEAAFSKLIKFGTSFDLELEILNVSGRKIWVRAVAKAIFEGGNVSRLYGTIKDISLRKHSDQARDHLQSELHKSHAFIQGITDAISDPIFVKNSDRRFVYGNQAFSDMLKLTPADYLGKTDHDLFTPEMADWFWKKDTLVFESQKETETEEPIADLVNGGFSTILTKKTPRTMEDGSQILVGVIRDITERKKAEERSRTLHALIESSGEAFAYFTLQGEPLFLNLAAKQVFGLDPQASSIASYFSRDFSTRLFGEIIPQVASGQSWEGETELIHGNDPGGEAVPVWQRFFSIPDELGRPKYLATTALDIRQKKNAEAKLQQSAKLSALGEMAGGIAHEINSPLAIIHGRAVQLAELPPGSKVEANLVIEVAQKIRATAMRISKIVKALRSFARDMEGEPFENLLVAGVIDDTFEFCRERFLNHSVELDTSQVDRALKVDCMPVQLSQVILNLLNNAFDAIAALPERWIRIAARAVGENIEIEVIDCGSGIPAPIAERIMQPFFTTKEIGKGTGLGLSVSKGIIESHGGALILDSSCPNTRFVIRFPVRASGQKGLSRVA